MYVNNKFNIMKSLMTLFVKSWCWEQFLQADGLCIRSSLGLASYAFLTFTALRGGSVAHLIVLREGTGSDCNG